MTKGSRIKTLSRDDGWFDGHGTADLRAWLRFWENENRSEGRAEEAALEDPERFAGMKREDHIAMIKAEIEARATNGRGRPRAELPPRDAPSSSNTPRMSQAAKRRQPWRGTTSSARFAKRMPKEPACA